MPDETVTGTAETTEPVIAVKSGWQTSEAWITLVTSVIAIMGAVGLIGPENLPAITENIKNIVLGIFALVTVLGYARERSEVKKAAITAERQIIVEAVKAEAESEK